MIYNNYPDDYIVVNAKWVEWDNDEQKWYFMTEDAFEKAQSLTDYTKQVRKEVCEEIRSFIEKPENSIYWDCSIYVETEELRKVLDQIQEDRQ